MILFVVGLLGLSTLGGFLLRGGRDGISRRFGANVSLQSHSIALLTIDGSIMPGSNYDFWMKSLKEIADDPHVKGVILRLESPGGAVGSSQEIYDEILQMRTGHNGKGAKKVYASMGDLAASGAYYIAAATDRIFANRGTLTGSIGVISTNYRVEDLAEKAGVKVEVVKSGRFKDAGSPFRPMTDAEKKVFDLLINDTYAQFVDDVLAQREPQIASAYTSFKEEDWAAYQFTKPMNGTSREFLLQIADGRVYTGVQALKLGLVDELGSLNLVISRLAKDLNIKGRPEVYEPQQRLPFFDMLFSKVSGAVTHASANWSHPTLQYRIIPF